MHRRLVGMLCLALVASCRSGPQVRSGPPMKVTFAPPAGMAQTARSDLERASMLKFSDKTGEGTSVRQIEEAEEQYAPLPDGGYRVTSTLKTQALIRDGQQITPPVSTIGISLVFRIDRDGNFVVLENGDDVIKALKARARDDSQRKMLDNTLTPEMIEAIPRESWRERHERYCGKTFTPGDVQYSVVTYELPVPRAPVRALVKQQVLGQTTFGVTPVLEVHLTYAGSDSPLVHTEEAETFLASQPPDNRALTANLEGEGRRLVSLSTCETIEDNFSFEGKVPLPPPDRSIPKAILPDSVQYRIKQQLSRFSPKGGQSL